MLASRISERAILPGKLVVTVGYTWGMALASLLLGLVLVNLLSEHGIWAFYYSFDAFLEAVALSLLASILGASAGVLISLQSATVRQAQQILSVGTLVLICGGIFALQTLSPNVTSSLSYSQLLLPVIADFAVLDAILLGSALMGFQRAPDFELSIPIKPERERTDAYA